MQSRANEIVYIYTSLYQMHVDMLAKALMSLVPGPSPWKPLLGVRQSPMPVAAFWLTAPNSTQASHTRAFGTRIINKDITAVMAVPFVVE